MRRLLAILTVCLPLQANAQTAHRDHMATGDMHAAHMRGTAIARPLQAGQGAFAAIQEIVEILEADPNTDWTKVNIDALRQHLVDMNNVTLAAIVKTEPVEGGMRYSVTGSDPITGSIRRMVTAHAATMNNVDGWTFKAADIESGAALTVLVPANDASKLRGLGFLGVMTHGMHHQEHHLMIARGGDPHH
jgi:hypothetical protein